MIISQDTTIYSGQALNTYEKIQVAEGVTLRIEGGASLINANIQVYGKLEVAGSALNRVNLNSTSISFSDDSRYTGSVSIDYANWNGGSFLSASGYGSYGSFDLKNSFLSNLSGSYIWYPVSDISVVNNVFYRSGGLSIGTSNANIKIEHNVFLDTYSAPNGSASIVNWANYGKQVDVHYNAFLGYGAALELPSGYSSASMSASNNWYGTLDTNFISSKILDRSDDLSRAGYIPFSPFLTSPESVVSTMPWVKLGSTGNETLSSEFTAPGQVLIGGGGRDSFVVHSSSDRIISGGWYNRDTVYADDTDFSLAIGASGTEILVLRGSGHTGSGNNLLGGLYGNDALYSYGDNNNLLGGSGSDALFSFGHTNHLYGGEGNDVYTLTTQDTYIHENPGALGGTDTIYANGTDFSLSFNGQSLNVEELVIRSDAHIGTGTDNNDVLIAEANNVQLFGGGGNDTLVSHGTGNILYGSVGDDNYITTSRNVSVREAAGEGNDTIYADDIDFSLSDAPNVEALVIRGNNHVGAGTNGADLLISQGISNFLFGGGGNDTFSFTPSRGATQILDFDARSGEHDVAAFTTTQFANFAVVQSNLTQVGADAVITAADGSGDTFILKNVVATNLNASDFLFV